MSLLAIGLYLAAAAAGPGQCAITAVAKDADPRGLKVRAAPSRRGRVIGRLWPAMDPHSVFHDDKAGLAESLVGAQFTVTRVSGSWLHIADIDPVTDGIGPDGSLQPVPNHAGAGWVHSSKVDLLPRGAGDLLARPDPASARVGGPGGVSLQARIVGCSGDWAQVRDRSLSGWVRSQSNAARARKIAAALKPRAKAR